MPEESTVGHRAGNEQRDIAFDGTQRKDRINTVLLDYLGQMIHKEEGERVVWALQESNFRGAGESIVRRLGLVVARGERRMADATGTQASRLQHRRFGRCQPLSRRIITCARLRKPRRGRRVACVPVASAVCDNHVLPTTDNEQRTTNHKQRTTNKIDTANRTV